MCLSFNWTLKLISADLPDLKINLDFLASHWIKLQMRMGVGVFMSGKNRVELLLKGTGRPRWRGQYMTTQ